MAKEDHIIHLENGRLAPDTPRSKITEMVQQGVDNGHIVIHFHGGLVSYSSGMQIVERLLPRYEACQVFPLFYVWESGLLETLQNNFPEIAEEKLFRILWKRISSIIQRKFGQTNEDRSAFVLPAVDDGDLKQSIDRALDSGNLDYLEATELVMPGGIDELSKYESVTLENELIMDAQLSMAVQEVSAGLRDPVKVNSEIRSRIASVKGSSSTLMDPRTLERLIERPVSGHRGLVSTAKLIKAVVNIAGRIISRYIKGRSHGFHATVVEEILRELYLANVGEFIWNTMKKDTVDSFKDDGTIYGGTALLESLAQNIDPVSPPRITLIGHSAGAIYISKFVEKAVTLLPDQSFEVILLAPAATCELIADTLTDYDEKISGFRMFTMTDAFEKKDQLVNIVYPHSLLYFISGVLEGGFDVPLIGMARFYDEAEFPDASFPALATVREYVSDDAARVVWSVNDTSSDGHRSASEKHGDFDNDDETLESIAHILKNGFPV